ncbi:hypothetical protein QBC40DRAFT_298251 [Triangularia verruculosa]|uniref:Ankyrin repeat protein n=1 Tax=Triangularia verruculosa TaxID=2587418 RepID=A0AAN7AV83_9PEZI|nr:hypothetical protein QBC40DRAFT_298251 [Triangularia verruculosa]
MPMNEEGAVVGSPLGSMRQVLISGTGSARASSTGSEEQVLLDMYMISVLRQLAQAPTVMFPGPTHVKGVNVGMVPDNQAMARHGLHACIKGDTKAAKELLRSPLGKAPLLRLELPYNCRTRVKSCHEIFRDFGAIRWATAPGNLAIVWLLTSHGADPSRTTGFGLYAVHLAAVTSQPQVAERLLDILETKHPEWFEKEKFGAAESPAHLVAAYIQGTEDGTTRAAAMDNADAVKVLLDNGQSCTTTFTCKDAGSRMRGTGYAARTATGTINSKARYYVSGPVGLEAIFINDAAVTKPLVPAALTSVPCTSRIERDTSIPER